jgi:TRAP-type transport system small permease protein
LSKGPCDEGFDRLSPNGSTPFSLSLSKGSARTNFTRLSESSMNTIERAITRLCQVILWLATCVIFLILCANTVLRYVKGSSLQWGNEVPELLFPWLVMAGVVLAALHGAHITTTFLVEKVPFALRRVLGVLGWLVVAGMYATLSVATWRMLEIVHDEKSPILGVPGSITYACVMGGMALLALLALSSAWRAWQAQPVAMSADADGAPPMPAAHW